MTARLSMWMDIHTHCSRVNVHTHRDRHWPSLSSTRLRSRQAHVDRLEFPGDPLTWPLIELAALPPGARMFFETEFPHKSFVDTKRQIVCHQRFQ